MVGVNGAPRVPDIICILRVKIFHKRYSSSLEEPMSLQNEVATK